VLVANVDTSRLVRDPRRADAVSSGEGDGVGSQRQEKPPCKGQILMAGVVSPGSRGARLEETLELTAEIVRLLDEKENRLLEIRKQQNTTESL
jgi:hypothetical protein